MNLVARTSVASALTHTNLWCIQLTYILEQLSNKLIYISTILKNALGEKEVELISTGEMRFVNGTN